MAALYVVSTPIGNLGDMTSRAVETLRAADIVLAEDTRRTGVLLKHLGVEARLISAHQHNEQGRAASVVEWLAEGKEVALVTDAGTPLLSDPGARIVQRVVEAGFRVIPIPGASALLAALVGSALPADRFTFYAFLPRKGAERTELLREIAGARHTSVMYESPNRLGRLLADLAAECGPQRRAVVARELTKLYEEFMRGTLGELAARYADAAPLGEVVVVVEGAGEGEGVERATAEGTAEAALLLARSLLGQGLTPSATARELRQRLGVARNAAYALVQQVAESGAEE